MEARTVRRFIELCRAEKGYTEKDSKDYIYEHESHAGHSNWTKYAEENWKAGMYNGYKNGHPYCDTFYDNRFLHLCDMDRVEAEKRIYQDQGDCGAGVYFSAQYYKNVGQFDNTPRLGDQIFFDDFNHTGAVVEIDGDSITVIEANNNDRVEENVYDIHDKRIDGYGHPQFDPELNTKPEKSNEDIAREVIHGDWGNGDERCARLRKAGYNPDDVQTIVNHILINANSKKSNETIAREVIHGDWGVNPERRDKLVAAGYDYAEIQRIVNRLIGKW